MIKYRKFLLLGTNREVLTSFGKFLAAMTRSLQCFIATEEQEAFEHCRWQPEALIILDHSIVRNGFLSVTDGEWNESVLKLARFIKGQSWGKNAPIFMLYHEEPEDQEFKQLLQVLIGNNGQVFLAPHDWGTTMELIIDFLEDNA
ncbi:MAG: hypothetical protein Q8M83_00925 [bacterium]|nr:hypothetical protein [bacterium]